MIAGSVHADGTWISGFFDKDSWTETLADWGKSVVRPSSPGRHPDGRDRGRNTPHGAAYSCRSRQPEVARVCPAQAGQVWFPDSAHKTATAIRDFNNAENLRLSSLPTGVDSLVALAICTERSSSLGR